MVNTHLFKTKKGKLLAATDTYNEAGGKAYQFSPRHQLAQLAATGCLNQTFYANASSQLETVLDLCQQIDTDFIAKTAVYAREVGYMKDMPALLMAVLAQRDVQLLSQIFNRVINNGKMLRNFVQIIRSGATGRKSLGTRPKKLVQQWLLNATERQLLNASVGNQPTLADVVKMVHPTAQEEWRRAWFGWLIGRAYDFKALPLKTQAFECFKNALQAGQADVDLPDVPFQMLTAQPLTCGQWAAIARNGSWQMVRQNLNTFARHGVFTIPGMTEIVAAKLRDADAIAKASVMPYQLMVAYQTTRETIQQASYAADGKKEYAVPLQVCEALQDALEIALANVPVIGGQVVVCPDVSGSMSSPVTGYRQGATTAVRCVDVAALVAAAMVRKNPQTQVIPFEVGVRQVDLNPRDTVISNANKLAALCGGGTSVSAPLALLNKQKAQVDLVVIVSDNESWIDNRHYGASQTMLEWEKLKKRCPKAKLVCLDIQPYRSTQAKEREDIMNIGGFSDAVFDAIAAFSSDNTGKNHWVDTINRVALAAH